MLIGARSSPLSRAQVEEMKQELGIDFDVIYVESPGDRDKISSLRTAPADFFTRDLDEMVLSGKIDGAIHSAKDLPDPLPQGLQITYLSKGLDPHDSLVILKEPIEVVATSSERREAAVKKLYPEARFIDARGTIHERLLLTSDAVVIAECAILRLKLGHLPRQQLQSPHPLQGKLALVQRQGHTYFP